MKKQPSHLLVTFVIGIFICFAFPNFSSAQSLIELIKLSKIMSHVKLRSERVYEIVPFKLKNDVIIIPVIINGKTYNFIFDTGAVTLFSDSLAKSLNRTPSVSFLTTDSEGITEKVDFYCTDSVQVGALYFDNVGYGVLNLNKFEELLCMRIDGILGNNVFRRFNWEIDFFNKTIRVSKRPFSVDSYSMNFHFKRSFDYAPRVKMQMGKYVFYAIFDMGYNGSIMITDTVFFKSGKSDLNLKYSKGEDLTVVSLFNERMTNNEYEVEIDSFYIGNNLILNEDVNIEPYPSTNLIGNSFLKQYGKITINWKQKKIFLGEKAENKNNTIDTTLTFEMGIHDDRLIVTSAWEDSEVYKKGIRIGDRIISFNGISTEHISHSLWCEIREIIENTDEYTIEFLTATGEKISANLKKISR